MFEGYGSYIRERDENRIPTVRELEDREARETYIVDLPQPRQVSEAVKFDCAVIVGVLAVLAIALWLRLPVVQDAVLLVLSAVAGISGAWAIWAVLKVVAKS